jgi:Flp pilus assembly protein TadG
MSAGGRVTREPRVARSLRRWSDRFWSETEGATAVQALVIMPAILFAFAAGTILWQTVNIRKDLHYGTYQATRFLSLYPPDSIIDTEWEAVAAKLVEVELVSNPWVRTPLNPANFTVDVTLTDSNECGDEFTVEVTYRLFVPKGTQEGATASLLPPMDQLSLRELRYGKVVCD